MEKKECLKCILLTNSYDMLSATLISLYGVYPPKSGQYQEINFHEDNIYKIMIEQEKKWAVYESPRYGPLVFFALKGHHFFIARHRIVVDSIEPIVEF